MFMDIPIPQLILIGLCMLPFLMVPFGLYAICWLVYTAIWGK